MIKHNKEEIKKEIEFIKRFLDVQDMPFKLCHNDIHSRNVIFDSNTGRNIYLCLFFSIDLMMTELDKVTKMFHYFIYSGGTNKLILTV